MINVVKRTLSQYKSFSEKFPKQGGVFCLSGYEMDSKNLIDGFINEHVIRQGLDNRTEKAYRLDLEHFCAWMKQMDSLSSRMKVSFDLEHSIKS